MNLDVAIPRPSAGIQWVTTIYTRLLLIGFAFIPAYLIAYLYVFQDPKLIFENHAFHEVAIAAATLEGLFVTYVCWRCYRSSGEPLLRWLTLGFLGFSLIYAWHGVFTGMAHHNIWLFLLYGPASRLIMAVLLFVGQLSYNRHADGEAYRTNRHIWLAWLALFLAIDTGVAWIAYSPTAGSPWVRVSMEGGALAFSAINVIALLTRRIRSPLMTIYGISVTAFALSSLAFILGRPWNHMWWLAHAIFAAGFFLLSYGVVKAFQTTRSFSTIYSQEELMTRLGEAKAGPKTHCANCRRRTTSWSIWRPPIRSPAWRTGASSSDGWRPRLPMQTMPARRFPCWRSTWTASRPSTIPMATRQAITSCSALPRSASRRSAPTTASPASAAKNSWCCCRKSPSAQPMILPSGSGPRSPPHRSNSVRGTLFP